jgi:single-strand DNA-binding protein
MASYNRIVLVGNLTRDPDLQYTPSNTAVCKFGIATNRKWKDREGGDREEVCYVDCRIFGRGAETFAKYMRKSREILVEGRLVLDQWTTKEGDKRSRHEVAVDNFTFIGGPGGGGKRESNNGKHGQSDAPPSTPEGEDIPF